MNFEDPDIEKVMALAKPLLDPVPGYDGPHEIRPFSAHLAAIGEVVIAFSRVERRLTWGIESCLRIRPVDADAIEETIMSVTTRINLFSTLAAAHLEEESETASELAGIVSRLHKANTYRNELLHGPWTGLQAEVSADGTLSEPRAAKNKFAPLGAKKREARSLSFSVKEMRAQAVAMLQLAADMQGWVVRVFPHAENRVP